MAYSVPLPESPDSAPAYNARQICQTDSQRPYSPTSNFTASLLTTACSHDRYSPNMCRLSGGLPPLALCCLITGGHSEAECGLWLAHVCSLPLSSYPALPSILCVSPHSDPVLGNPFLHADTTRHDTTRHDMTRHDTTRHDMTRHDTTRHDMTRHDTTRHDSRHDTTHDTTQPSALN
jgi:hypothetical protein